MTMTGGCYCGALRFEITGEIPMRALCLCKTCQKISGGGGNFFIGVEASAFRYTRGEPSLFKREDSADSPTREFCGKCGVHIAARSPKAPGGLIVKVGALDDPSVFEVAKLVFWTQDKQLFHAVPAEAKSFATIPGR